MESRRSRQYSRHRVRILRALGATDYTPGERIGRGKLARVHAGGRATQDYGLPGTSEISPPLMNDELAQ